MRQVAKFDHKSRSPPAICVYRVLTHLLALMCIVAADYSGDCSSSTITTCICVQLLWLLEASSCLLALIL